MAAHTKVLNISRDCRIKRSQALNRIDQGLSAWVEEGFTIRDLTLAETIGVRAQRARESSPLPGAELQLLTFAPPETARAYIANHRGILTITREFVQQLRMNNPVQGNG